TRSTLGHVNRTRAGGSPRHEVERAAIRADRRSTRVVGQTWDGRERAERGVDVRSRDEAQNSRLCAEQLKPVRARVRRDQRAGRQTGYFGRLTELVERGLALCHEWRTTAQTARVQHQLQRIYRRAASEHGHRPLRRERGRAVRTIGELYRDRRRGVGPTRVVES